MEKLVYLEKDFQELFIDLHTSGLFPDGKEISDAITYTKPESILEEYRDKKDQSDFDLMTFYKKHFQKAPSRDINYVSDTSKPVEEHIEKLWDILARTPEKEDFYSSRIALPYPYIVPGGRFNEIYYWDSYFTMLGLKVSGRTDLIEGMVQNFAEMIKEFGFIPNGNRSYYLGRSQPPFFSLMVELLSELKGASIITEYLTALELEYEFWMTGAKELDADQSFKRVVKMPDGEILNRYFDNIPDPRAEMYQDDVELIAEKGREGKETLLNIRAACESGWDFSSRWCEDPMSLASIQTTNLVQVDLNCLLWKLEKVIARGHELNNDHQKAEGFNSAATRRAQAILKYFWSNELKTFTDYDHQRHSNTSRIHAASAYPLFFEICSEDQAKGVQSAFSSVLIKPGGLMTTSIESGQQWDAPNGWAPLQWIGIQGLRNYGYNELAHQIKENWCHLNTKVFKSTGKLMEKYNVVNIDLESGGGEYPVQDGFGWTNGVLLALLSEKG